MENMNHAFDEELKKSGATVAEIKALSRRLEQCQEERRQRQDPFTLAADREAKGILQALRDAGRKP